MISAPPSRSDSLRIATLNGWDVGWSDGESSGLRMWGSEPGAELRVSVPDRLGCRSGLRVRGRPPMVRPVI